MTEERILSEITLRRDELVSLCQDLVRIPTLNPPGRLYREICDYVGARLAAKGFKVEFIRAHGAPGDSDTWPRWNVLARHEGTRPGECVHFNSHHDVVEVGHGWTRDPFGGELDAGRIYGRGACDMKGGLAASIIAAEAFIAACPDYAGAIEISARPSMISSIATNRPMTQPQARSHSSWPSGVASASAPGGITVP